MAMYELRHVILLCGLNLRTAWLPQKAHKPQDHQPAFVKKTGLLHSMTFFLL
jgi:hypothetical protein